MTKDDGVETVTPGETVTYTITVTNNGPSDVDSLVLTDAVPPELVGPTFTPTEGTYDPATGEWTGLALAPGDSVTMELTATVDPAATGELTNTVTVELPAGFTDPTPENNTASDTDTLTPSSGLTIDKDGPETAQEGDLVTYTIVVTNTGPSSAADIVVTDPAPAGADLRVGVGRGLDLLDHRPGDLLARRPTGPERDRDHRDHVPGRHRQRHHRQRRHRRQPELQLRRGRRLHPGDAVGRRPGRRAAVHGLGRAAAAAGGRGGAGDRGGGDRRPAPLEPPDRHVTGARSVDDGRPATP